MFLALITAAFLSLKTMSIFLLIIICSNQQNLSVKMSNRNSFCSLKFLDL